MAEKLITFTIPCYNSAEYMDHCIQTIIDGSAKRLEDIEVIIVDDGSMKDDTPAKADSWEARYPGVIRAIHQENAGHGGAVNKGLANARGEFFKVVDSDDWLDEESLDAMLDLIEAFEQSSEEPIDLFLANYVYEHVERGQEVMDYKKSLPVGRPFGWSEIRKFGISRYILMHSVIFRTSVLRDCGLRLPEHTFYVDNIFVYVPLPYAKRMMYLDLDLYRWFIGREDQSINEKVMASRIEQQLRVTRELIDSYDLSSDVAEPKLAAYMGNYLAMMLAICSVFSLLSEREDKYELRAGIWNYLKERNPNTYRFIRGNPLVLMSNSSSKAWGHVELFLYHVAQKLFKFN
ncbi:MAG: glycosyltransferase family 2 protein [bacterium]|nr:glycosyltransferase family 2 protein [bacterium]